MRVHISAFFLFLSLPLIIGCGNDSKNDIINAQQGAIFGTVTNNDTNIPIKGASVQVGTKVVQTDENGKYIIKDIPLSNNIEVTIIAQEYKEYHNAVSLQQELLSLDVKLTPIQSPSAPILAALDSISKGIESLDPTKIPDIQSYFSANYVAGSDEATAAGVFSGVVPPDYKSIPDTTNNIIKKYKTLSFRFANPEVKFDGDSASVQMRLTINAETMPPDPALWNIVVDSKMTLQKQDDSWKINFWGLIPPFLKFDRNPI